MADRYAGHIQIGGPLPVRRLPELACVIRDVDPDIGMCWSNRTGNGITAAHLRDWLRKRDKLTTLDLYAGELVDGSFPALETWLEANGLSYLRHSDAYCDVEAEIVGYMGGVRVRSDANNAGDAMVRACDMRQVRTALAEGNVLDAMALLDRLLPNVFDIPPFTVEYAEGRFR